MKSEMSPLMDRPAGDKAPKAFWATAVPSRRNPSRYLPQTIAHRGYKASWPENSMGAFRGAVTVGAHAIETDVHLSADGVVVLSHDLSLKRCFGVDKKINECSWEYLAQLRTLREPHEALPRLGDLLEYLAEPGLEKIWVLLDIKADDGADDLIGAIARTIAAAPESAPWSQRIMLGCWNATYLEAARRILPAFPTAIIAFTLLYAKHFLAIPDIGINMFQKMLVGPSGSSFLRNARDGGHPMFAWTVNDERWMEWCVQKNAPPKTRGAHADALGVRLLDGVITDDPKLFLEVCDRWEDVLDGKVAPRRRGLLRQTRDGVVTVLEFLVFSAATMIFYLLFRFVFKKKRLDLPKETELREVIGNKV